MIEVHLMDIIWHGHSCFELVSGGYSAVIDPFQDTSVGTAYPHVRLTADAVYISHEDRDHNFREGVTLRRQTRLPSRSSRRTTTSCAAVCAA